MTSKYSGIISQQCIEKVKVSVQQSSEWQATVRAEDAKITNAETFAKFLDWCEVRVMWLSEEEKVRRNVDIGLKIIITTSKMLKNISKNHYFSGTNAAVQIKRLSPLESS